MVVLKVGFINMFDVRVGEFGYGYLGIILIFGGFVEEDVLYFLVFYDFIKEGLVVLDLMVVLFYVFDFFFGLLYGVVEGFSCVYDEVVVDVMRVEFFVFLCGVELEGEDCICVFFVEVFGYG